MAQLRDIVIDCANPAALARFWAAVLDGYSVRAYDDDEIARLAALGLTPETDPSVAVDGPGPGLFFVLVPEAKTTKNRLHLDLTVPDRDAAVPQFCAMGARVVADHEDWVVLADPEGNEFCLFDG